VTADVVARGKAGIIAGSSVAVRYCSIELTYSVEKSFGPVLRIAGIRHMTSAYFYMSLLYSLASWSRRSADIATPTEPISLHWHQSESRGPFDFSPKHLS
jgi:hypothetical protein